MKPRHEVPFTKAALQHSFLSTKGLICMGLLPENTNFYGVLAGKHKHTENAR